MAEFESRKHEKRRRERQRRKEKKASGVWNPPSRKSLKYNKPDANTSKISIAFDLQFDELMNDKDISKCIRQLTRCYQINRRSKCPIPIYFAGLNPNTRTQKVFEKNDGWDKWDVKYSEENYLNVGFPKEKIIYLTSEADDVLDELEEGALYVIGALVDHNSHKGQCFDNAQKDGVRTVRLPLSEYVEMKTRAVLTINHGKNFSAFLSFRSSVCFFIEFDGGTYSYFFLWRGTFFFGFLPSFYFPIFNRHSFFYY